MQLSRVRSKFSFVAVSFVSTPSLAVRRETGAQSIAMCTVQLMNHVSKRPSQSIVVKKVKAHLNHVFIQGPTLKWKAWANKQVDKIAKDACSSDPMLLHVSKAWENVPASFSQSS